MLMMSSDGDDGSAACTSKGTSVFYTTERGRFAARMTLQPACQPRVSDSS